MKIFVSTLLALALITFAFIIIKGGNNSTPAGPVNNVTIVDGKQIIDLTVKSGYSPEKSVAKAGVPTILRFITNGTFDCSSSVRIPSLNMLKTLSSTGTTDIDLGNPKAGIMRGSCSMGMYPFEINFQ